jgi:hypothetical protein
MFSIVGMVSKSLNTLLEGGSRSQSLASPCSFTDAVGNRFLVVTRQIAELASQPVQIEAREEQHMTLNC